MIWDKASGLPAFRHRLSTWSLRRRFAMTGGLVMLVAMALIGSLVTATISENAIDSSAAATALYMDSFISPLAQELAEGDTLSVGPIRALDELADSPQLRDRVRSIKIWKPGGLVVYASDLNEIGKRFDPDAALAGAFRGDVQAQLDQLDDNESASEKAIGVPLLEIYSPIRADWTGDVIGVAEFYENATALTAAQAKARWTSWGAIALVTLLIGASLFGLVNSGSRTIERQQAALRQKVAESVAMSEENRRLRQRAERASSRVSEMTEANLRRVSADLHDGPAQLVSLAALRLDGVRTAGSDEKREQEIGAMELALKDAIREIRDISRGLSLPDLKTMPLQKVVNRAVQSHEALTNVHVAQAVEVAEIDAPVAAKACLYRFLQEGLNNAFRHAPGADVAVRTEMVGGTLAASVENGPPKTQAAVRDGGGMGLQGLRQRIESLGGNFNFVTLDGGGARLSMQIDLLGGAFHD